MSHANARTNLFARRLIVERVAVGWPPAHVAEQLGISRLEGKTQIRRRRRSGIGRSQFSGDPNAGHRTPERVEHKVLAARRRRKRGAVVLAAELGLNPSTVGRILARYDVPHLMCDRPDHR